MIPALKWNGSKAQLAEKIVCMFPDHSGYVEPFFGGSAGILMAKKPAKRELINDRDGQVVNFFRCLREHREELVEAIALTPYARQELEESALPIDSADPVEMARKFYVSCNQRLHGTRPGQLTAWRSFIHERGGGSNPAFEFTRIGHLLDLAERLKEVQIENVDYRKLDRHDFSGCLWYVDPPYLFSTRSDSRLYEFDFGSEYDHIEMLHFFRRMKGMVIISGYPSQLYDETLTGWKRVEIQMKNNNRDERTECLWFNQNCGIQRIA